MYVTVSLVDYSFLSGKRFSQVFSPRSNPSPTPPTTIHRDVACLDEKKSTHHCTSPWGSSRSDYPAHLCPLFGAWRVPRVSEPQLTVRVLSHASSVPFLAPLSGPSCSQSPAPPRDASLAAGAYWQATLLHPGTRGITSAPSWGRVRGRSGLRATEPMIEAGWGKRPATEPKCLHLRACDTTLHSQCTYLRGKSEHSAAASKK